MKIYKWFQRKFFAFSYRSVFFWARRGKLSRTMFCGNRFEAVYMFGGVEMTITTRRTNEPDAYSRGELYQMLRTVRAHESLMGWKCPEPEFFKSRWKA